MTRTKTDEMAKGHNITLEEAIAGLKRAVEEKGPDHVVEGCRYFDSDNTPVCVVGHVFSYHGYGYDDVARDNQMVCKMLFSVNMDDHARVVLEAAQRVQDSREDNTWGEALDAALELAEGMRK